MPMNEDRKTEVWHHERGWISGEQREWEWSEDDETQAQLDMDDAEAAL